MRNPNPFPIGMGFGFLTSGGAFEPKGELFESDGLLVCCGCSSLIFGAIAEHLGAIFNCHCVATLSICRSFLLLLGLVPEQLQSYYMGNHFAPRVFPSCCIFPSSLSLYTIFTFDFHTVHY